MLRPETMGPILSPHLGRHVSHAPIPVEQYCSTLPGFLKECIVQMHTHGVNAVPFGHDTVQLLTKCNFTPVSFDAWLAKDGHAGLFAKVAAADAH